MPYLLLAAGVILLILTVLRFSGERDPLTLRRVSFMALGFALLILLFYLSVTGRWPLALALAAIAFWPYFGKAIRAYIHARKNRPAAGNLSRQEAMEILGVGEDASEEEIRAAHHGLIRKNHPDQTGSDWYAKKINMARDILLKNKN